MKKIILTAAALIAISTTAQAEWKKSIKVDEMEGFTRTVYSIDSGKARFIHRNQTNIDNDDLYLITGDGYICAPNDYLDIKLKVDDQPVEDITVSLSTKKTALFFKTTKEVKNPNSTYTNDGYFAAWKKDGLKDGPNVEAYYAEHGTLDDKYKTVDNGIINKIRSAKKVFVRIHDTCGTQTTLKFVNN